MWKGGCAGNVGNQFKDYQQRPHTVSPQLGVAVTSPSSSFLSDSSLHRGLFTRNSFREELSEFLFTCKIVSVFLRKQLAPPDSYSNEGSSSVSSGIHGDIE